MSYANQGSGRERIVAVGLVGLIQGGIIAALVSGLAVQFATRPADPPLRTYDVPNIVPPPPVEPVEVEKPLMTTAIPIADPVAPDPIVPTLTEKPVLRTIDIIPPPPTFDIAPTPIPSPAITPTPAADLSRRAAPRGSVADWFPQRDYPAAALRGGVEGRVSVLLSVSPAGRATGCEVVATSGDAGLDAATCRLALRNGRFEPARDAAGAQTATKLRLPPIVWRIAE